ncbi:YraN family protein [Microaceticoccus formicicus]|uniref:YraN family protein n=1 Tax=Microaceticoccus formicicus TaxID=3118105 RepID=UPI003CD03C0D|nr:YraN family protein [Peptoniphilaceae bacterium AMB_02]
MSLDIGKRGEDLAVEYLTKKGMLIIDRNYRIPMGEIDIIAVEGDILVFIEVKTRSSDAFGAPSEFVSPDQRRRIICTAEIYMKTKNLTDMQPRFDVCEIYSNSGDINYLDNAFPYV